MGNSFSDIGNCSSKMGNSFSDIGNRSSKMGNLFSDIGETNSDVFFSLKYQKTLLSNEILNIYNISMLRPLDSQTPASIILATSNKQQATSNKQQATRTHSVFCGEVFYFNRS